MNKDNASRAPRDQREAGQFPVTLTLSYNAMVGALHACMKCLGDDLTPSVEEMHEAVEAISAEMDRIDEAGYAAMDWLLARSPDEQPRPPQTP